MFGVPFRKAGMVLGMAILWATVLNALVFMQTSWGSEWFYSWSFLFVFLGVLLVTFAWQDHLLATILAAVAAFVWWWFILGGF